MMMLSAIQQQQAYCGGDFTVPTTNRPLSPTSPSRSHTDYANNNRNCSDADRCVSRCAAYGHVCPCAARAAGQAAQHKMSILLENSVLFEKGLPEFHQVDSSDIILGPKLGTGGFSNVHGCAIKGQPFDESMAMKSLKREVMVRPKCFENGAADLATEACFLARLNHPNIVRLRAVTSGSIESNVSSSSGNPQQDAAAGAGGFFIVVDRLVETLHERILRWECTAHEVPNSIFYRLSREYKDQQRAMLLERLKVAVEIAGVMEYLHSVKTLFRDLKPDNIGFDKHGTLKLFDFGLAKEQKPSMRYEDGSYKMTGKTGSRRYMAPEVAKGEPYEKSVDVYSFGILIWEMCALEKPFAGYSSKKHYQHIVLAGERPKMDHAHTAHWPSALQSLMKSCWSADSTARPAFSSVKEILEDIVADMDLSASNRSNRSTKSLRSEASSGENTPVGKSITSHIKKPPRGWLRRARS